MNFWMLPLSRLFSVIDALADVPLFRDPAARRELAALLEDELSGEVAIEDHTSHRIHLSRIVDACRKHPDGLRALGDVLRLLDPDSLPMREALRRLAEVGAGAVLGALPDSERATLRVLIEGVETPAVQQATLAAAGSSVRPIRLRSSNVWEAYEDLEAMNAGPDGLPPAMVFLERIAIHLDERQAKLLEGWNDRQAAMLGLERELQAVREVITSQTPGQPVTAYLVIQLAPHGRDPGRYLLSNWRQLDPGGWHPERRDDQVVTGLRDVERQVESLVKEAETEWARFDGPMSVEFVLPRELLSVGVEEWVVESDTELPTPLGVRYPVTLRSLERMRRRDWHRLWRQRWKQWRERPATADTHWCRPDGEDYPRQLERRLMSDPRLVSMVLSAPPPQRPADVDEVLIGLRAGLPVLIWHREDCEHHDFQQAVLQLLYGDLTDMPERVKSLRGLGGRGPEQVVVLLDDPDRLLESNESPEIAS